MKEQSKRGFKRIVVFFAAFMLLLSLVSCGGNKLSGTYKSEGLISQTLTFKGDKVKISAFGISADGTYKIDGDNIIITYDLFGQEMSLTQSYSKNGKSIYIGGTEFRKR